MANPQPIFPKALLSWTPRIDEVDTIWANDPNTLASDLISVESTLGTMPQVEKSPYVGNPVTYANVDARITDTLSGTLNPYVSMTADNFKVYNNQGSGSAFGQYVSFNKVYDPYGYYNGSDITIQTTGLYLISGVQSWAWNASGYLHHSLYIAGVWNAGDMWDWGGFASTGPGHYADNRNATTEFTWMGAIPAGQRVRVVAENGTSKNPYPVINSWLRLYCLRKLPPNVSG